MFKWSCLAVATAALLVFGWMLNDLRLEIKRTGEHLNQQLPRILEQTEQVTRTANDNLPHLLERSRVTAETFAEIAEDIKQLKELAGVTAGPRDKTLVSYAISVLARVEKEDASVGLRNPIPRGGLLRASPAKQWVADVRLWAVFLASRPKPKADYLKELCEMPLLKQPYYIQHGDQAPVPLLDWLKANHAESKSL
jgi:hypothetical protein